MSTHALSDAIGRLRRMNEARFSDGTSVVDRYADSDGVSAWSSQQYSLLASIQRHIKPGSSFLPVPSRSGTGRRTSWFSLFIKHGLAFFVTVLSIVAARLRGARVLIFDIERIDPNTHEGSRLRKVYDYLKGRRASYVSCIHSLFDDKFYLRFRAIREPTIYLESVHALARFFDRCWHGSSITGLEDEGLPDWMAQELRRHAVLARRSMLATRFWRIILRCIGISVLVCYDDLRHANELIWAARRSNVRSIAGQHGNFAYLVGIDLLPPRMYAFPDYFLVASSYWKDRLPELSPLFRANRERLVVSGWLGSQMNADCRCRGRSKKGALLIPFEILQDYVPMRRVIGCLLDSGFPVWFKLKPGASVQEQKKAYGIDGNHADRVRCVERLSATDMDGIAAAMGVYSTLLDEMLLRCIPIGLVASNTPLLDDKVQSGLADRLDPYDQGFVTAVESLIATDTETCHNRCQRYAPANVDQTAILDRFIGVYI